jgi:hypothetical protein
MALSSFGLGVLMSSLARRTAAMIDGEMTSAEAKRSVCLIVPQLQTQSPCAVAHNGDSYSHQEAQTEANYQVISAV